MTPQALATLCQQRDALAQELAAIQKRMDEAYTVLSRNGKGIQLWESTGTDGHFWYWKTPVAKSESIHYATEFEALQAFSDGVIEWN